MSEEPLENDLTKIPLDGDISYLSSVAIQIHEVFLELKQSGFTNNEALTITGMIMSNFITPDGYYTPNEDWDNFEPSGDEDGPRISLEFLEEDDEEDY